MNDEWLNVEDDLPGWGDSGIVELRKKDGSIVQGTLEIDAWFNGEDEVPVATIMVAGVRVSIFDFEQWRLVG